MQKLTQAEGDRLMGTVGAVQKASQLPLVVGQNAFSDAVKALSLEAVDIIPPYQGLASAVFVVNTGGMARP